MRYNRRNGRRQEKDPQKNLRREIASNRGFKSKGELLKTPLSRTGQEKKNLIGLADKEAGGKCQASACFIL